MRLNLVNLSKILVNKFTENLKECPKYVNYRARKLSKIKLKFSKKFTKFEQFDNSKNFI